MGKGGSAPPLPRVRAKFMARFIDDRAVDLGRIRVNDLDPQE